MQWKRAHAEMICVRREHEDKEKTRSYFSWKDYVAIVIGLLETVLLPFVLIIAVLFVGALLIRILFRV